ncbi:MAG: VOC family protein [Nanoarchaeota archaeon]
MQKMVPCLWFDNEAEEAVNFYKTVFKDVRILNTAKYLTETPSNKPTGSVMTIDFEINGNRFMALNGGSYFKFNEAISFVIYCKDQEEINYYYDKLSAVPESEMCGWIKDKFGVSWQLVTEGFEKLMTGKNGKMVMEELLKMKRLDVDKLKRIHEGK